MRKDEKMNQGYEINEFGEIIRNNPESHQPIADDIPHFEPPEAKETQEKQQPVSSNASEELARMARESRKFTILQRERAMDDAQRGKNRAAIMAGICMLGAISSVAFQYPDLSQINQCIQHELNAFYSWEALGQYFQDLGPLTTLLCTGVSVFFIKYLKDSRKLKQAQNEFIDFNAALENEQTLGGVENAKSR